MRFDKILNKDNQKKLLLVAVKSLIKIKKEININKKYNLPTYNYKIFHSEISEFVDYFFPFYKKKKMSNDLKEEFFSIWKSNFNSFDFNFTSFVHKDYNINNLIYLPNRRNHFKCGILDFQDSFWGEDCWDLFSLLEDSRIFFDDKYNDHFINYFCKETNKEKYKKEFEKKYHFLNCSRQTRLLGRWIKLSNMFKNKQYLNFIDVTNKRLLKSFQKPHLHKIKSFYARIFPNIYAN